MKINDISMQDLEITGFIIMKVMRTIFKYIIGGTLILSIVYACSEELTMSDNTSPVNQESVIKTRGDVPFQDPSVSAFIKGKKVTREFVPVILERSLDKTEFKDIDEYTLTTVTKDGRELIHVANFEKGGWAIVSGRFQTENQILAYGAEGEFDPNNIESPEVRFWLEMAEAMVENEMIEDEENDFEEMLRSGPYDNEPYVWVRFILDPQYFTTYNYSIVNHLVVTKWGQNEPWNYLCPYFGDVLCPLGCTAVAVGQMLYYLHGHIAFPSGLYHTIIPYYDYHYNSSDAYCTSSVIRSNYYSNSTRWASMATTNPGVLTTGVQYVGDLLIDIANRAESVFRIDETSGNTSTSLFSNYYDIYCTKSNFSQSTVVSSLNNSMPIMVSAKTSNSSNADGHEWIIDGYNSTYTVEDRRYKWRMVPPDSLSYFALYSYDYIYTEAEKQQFFPEVIEDEIVHEYSSFINYYYKMNWGWHDNRNSYDYDNGLYSFGNWDAGQHDLNYQIKIYHGFH